MSEKFSVESPFEGIAGGPPADCKGGPGEYNETPGYPGRTPSPNAAPEKFYDKEFGGGKIPDENYGTIAKPGSDEKI